MSAQIPSQFEQKSQGQSPDASADLAISPPSNGAGAGVMGIGSSYQNYQKNTSKNTAKSTSDTIVKNR